MQSSTYVKSPPLYTQGDTAGLVILHQQFILAAISSVFKVNTSLVSPSEPAMYEHIPIPLIGTLVAFVVQVVAQSTIPLPRFVNTHVVSLLFNATHFCTADAGAVKIAPTAVKVKSFFIFNLLSLFFAKKQKPPKTFEWSGG